MAMLKKQKEEEERRRQEEAERRRKEQEELKKVSWALNPVSPQYLYTNSPYWSSYICIKNKLREFDKRSKHFPLGDHFINSHNLFSCCVLALLGENWCLLLLGLNGLTSAQC